MATDAPTIVITLEGNDSDDRIASKERRHSPSVDSLILMHSIEQKLRGSVVYLVCFGMRSEADFEVFAGLQHAVAISLHDCSINNGSWYRRILKFPPDKSLTKSFAWRAHVKILRIHGDSRWLRDGCGCRRRAGDKQCMNQMQDCCSLQSEIGKSRCGADLVLTQINII